MILLDYGDDCSRVQHIQKLLKESEIPRLINESDAERALLEGFVVRGVAGYDCVFDSRALNHIKDHPSADAKGRLKRLQFAIDTVRTGKFKFNYGAEKRTGYAKSYGKKGVLVLADKNGVIQDVFDIIPKDTIRIDILK